MFLNVVVEKGNFINLGKYGAFISEKDVASTFHFFEMFFLCLYCTHIHAYIHTYIHHVSSRFVTPFSRIDQQQIMNVKIVVKFIALSLDNQTNKWTRCGT
jgi:hypothetical protein